MPLLQGQSDVSDIAVSELRGEMMVMDHEWKLVLDAQGQPVQFYDRHNDPVERCNLAADAESAPVRQRLTQAALHYLFTTRTQVAN